MATTLLVIGDGGAPTGFGRVTEGVLRNLPAGCYDIHQLAINYRGDPHRLPWRLYPAAAGGDVYGYGRVGELLRKVRPDIVFTVNDLWIQAEYLRLLDEAECKAKIVTYTPIEGPPVDPELLHRRGGVSRFVVYTEDSKAAVLEALSGDFGGPIDVIPHGIDRSSFHPLPGSSPTADAKRHLDLFSDDDIEDSFVVLNANRNQPRKRFDVTIEAFARFARGKPPNVKLYLHTGIEDAGWNILKLADRFGIGDRLVVTRNENCIPDVEVDELNLIFNACDVGLNTSSAEGWGLTSFEHAAAGKAQVVPDIPNVREIWADRAVLVKPAHRTIFPKTLVDAWLLRPEDVADALELLYSDRDLRDDRARRCHEIATSPAFAWERIGAQWHDLFTAVLAEGA